MEGRHTALIRRLFDCYRRRDREGVAAMMAEDFRLTTPYDDRIDKARYFELCWPAGVQIRENVIERIFEEDDAAYVTYRCTTVDGLVFHNTEFFSFAGEQVRAIDVFRRLLSRRRFRAAGLAYAAGRRLSGVKIIGAMSGGPISVRLHCKSRLRPVWTNGEKRCVSW